MPELGREERAAERNRQRELAEERRRVDEELRQQRERENVDEIPDEQQQQERDEEIGENDEERVELERGAQNYQERFALPQNMARDDRSLNLERMIGHMMQENQIRNEQINKRDKTIDTLIEQIQNMTRIIPNASSTPRLDENTTFNYNVMPDITKNVVQFDGEIDGMAAQSWINTLENMRQSHRWSDAYVLDAARTNLVGGAKRWFRTRASEILTWPDFQSAFKKTFLVQENLTTNWQRMVNRIQQRSETITTYFHDKYDLCHNLKLSFDESKELILTGLWSRDTANALLGCRHSDADDLLHAILKQEKMSNLRGERIGSSSRPKQSTEAKREDGIGRENNSDRLKEFVCYHCGVRGHLSRNCPEPKEEPTCYRCKKKGHISHQCPEVSNRRDVNQVTGFPKNGAEKYLKQVNVGGKTFSSFIDMGSSECIIKMTAALMNGFQFHQGTMELKAFGPANYKVVSPGYIRTSLTVDEASADNIIFRVVPDDVQACDVFIGRTFTELSHVVYQKIGDELTFHEKQNFNPLKDIETDEEDAVITINPESPLQASSINVLTTVRDNTTFLLPILNIGSEDVSAAEVLNIKQHITPTKAKIVSRKVEIKDVCVGEQQPPKVVDELVEILNEFRDCVSLEANEIGCHTDFSMEIEEIPGSKPFQSKPYPASELEKEKIRNIVSEWRKQGVVTDTNSAYSSPVLLVRKKTGDSRLVVDYRRLNNQTVKVNFPLPNIDDHVALLAGAKIFIVLDLAQGYLQIPIHPKDRHKTAFITPEETGEFTRMIFGLTNAPFYFTKIMQRVLGPLRNRIVLFYLDDILIPGRDWIDLKERLLLVFAALRKGGLTVQLKKCEFLRQRVNYLGFVISDRGIEPGQRKLLAIEDFPRPNNVHEVRRFLGLAGFFRRFVKQFSLRAAPLYELLKAQTSFEWSEERETAFSDLRNALLCKPILQLFDPQKYSELHTDASSRGLAAMLFQRGEDGKLHLVYAISRLTAESEKWYHSSKLELLAIMWATQRLRFLLINIEFKIITDCQALIFLNIQKTRNPQIARWYNLLCEFNFTIEHRPGTKLSHVDALSRAPTERCDPENVGDLCVFTLASDEDEILIYQSQDDNLQRKIEILKNKTPDEYTSYEKGEVQGFELDNGILYKNINGQKKYVVPKALRKSLSVRFHDFQGHFGLDRTLGKLQRFYYFPGMRRYEKQHIGACLHCLLAKTRTGKPAGQLHPIPPALKPFMVIHLDHIGPFITSSKGNKYILVLVDNLTKYVRLDAVRNTSAENVVRKLEDFVTEFGAPERVVSDRGTCFTSSRFETFCERHGIKHTLNSPRHAQANGQVERVNRTLLPTIMATLDENKEGKDWDRKLKMVARDLNNSDNKTTGKTPFELLYGYTPRFDEGLVRQMTIHEEPAKYERPELLREKAIEKIKMEQQKLKNRYDRGRQLNVQYNIGDIIYMSSSPQATGDSTKLHPRNRGPLVITQIMPGDTYGVATLRLDAAGRKYASTAHVSQLKLWKPTEEEETNLESETVNNPDDELMMNVQDPVEEQPNIVNPDDSHTKTSSQAKLNQEEETKTEEDDGSASEIKHVRPKRIINPPLRHKDYVI